MTEEVHGLLKNNIIFISMPFCSMLELAKSGDLYKAIGLCLFISALSIMYKLYVKAGDKDAGNAEEVFGIFSHIGFAVTAVCGVFAEVPAIRWLFLVGIVLEVTFSGTLSAILSASAYMIIVTLFTQASPDFVANSFLIALIMIMLVRYYSNFPSVIYSIITLLSFEAAFYIIMHGLKTDQIMTVSHLIDVIIISACIIISWLLNKYMKKQPDKEEDKDYSCLLNPELGIYAKLTDNEELYRRAKLNSRLVKEITQAVGGEAGLAEAGAFYAECGRLISSNYIKEGLNLAEQYNLPAEIMDFIKEHNFKVSVPNSRETAITMIVCKLSSTIAYLEREGQKKSAAQVVGSVMDSCLMSGKLSAAGLLLNDYKFIKDYLVKEAETGYDYFSGK